MKNELFENDFFVTDIVLAIRVRAGTGATLHRHRPSHGFALNTSGEKIYRFKDGTTLKVKKNDLIFLPRFSDYSVENVIDGDCYAINFLLDGDAHYRPFSVHIRSEKILQCFKRAERSFRLQPIDRTESCCKELYDIVCQVKRELYEQHYLSDRQHRILSLAEAYIFDRYLTENITLSDLSEQSGVSEVYLRKVFRAGHGMSPIAFVNNERLCYAKALLDSGEYSVSEVCFMSGFNDSSYFCRCYKNKYGFLPKETFAISSKL